MKSNLARLLCAVSLLGSVSVHAALNVFATVPEWGALAQELGGDKLKVFVATNALQDPHHVEAKPSLITRARNADLVIASGAELEVGWLPLVLRESGNSKVMPGQPGYFEAAQQVRMLEVPQRLDRADGDVHAGGNPHIQTGARNFLPVGSALAQRLAELDPANAAAYQAGYKAFAEKWQAALARWEKQAAPLRGVPVAVQHKAFVYLSDWLGLREIATLEPKPGVDPSAAYLSKLAAQFAAKDGNAPRMVLRSIYNSPRAADWISEKSGVPVVILPFTVGGSERAKDLFGLFDDSIERLLKALK